MEKLTWHSLKGGQDGASLLEYLIAMTIFLVVVLGLFSNMDHIIYSGKLNEIAPSVYEKDQVVRYEIITTMDYFQRELIINDCPDLDGDQILDENEIFFCTKPAEKLKNSQQNFTFPRTIYWGNHNDLFQEPYVRNIINQFDTLVASMTEKNSGKLHSSFTEALKSCENQSFKMDTEDIADRSSYFVCGFGKNILVQIKVNFWDFLSGSSAKCRNLNAKPGRGLQAVYRFFHIEPYKDEGKQLYRIAIHSSKLFIPKKVDAHFIPSRNLWSSESDPKDHDGGSSSDGKPDYMKNCRS
ncbi:MAG: hypothetical protein H6618_05250 [Deltaproteobacteria bacterium]|nr:hypothetical protein [Deltaproteobacteria bacterium]